jgi:hypothetical protein
LIYSKKRLLNMGDCSNGTLSYLFGKEIKSF